MTLILAALLTSVVGLAYALWITTDKVCIPRSDWEAAKYLLHHFRDRQKVDDLLDLITEHNSTRKS